MLEKTGDHVTDLHRFTQAHRDFTLIVHHIALIALIKATLSAFPSRPVIWVMWWHQRRRNPTAQVIKHTEQHAAVLPSLTYQGVFLIFRFIICLSPSRQSRRAFFFFFWGVCDGQSRLSCQVRVGSVALRRNYPPFAPGGRGGGESALIKILSCVFQVDDQSSLL